jgi:Domain of unknown function (DUF5942)
MVGACGLFFLPYVAPQLSSMTGVELFTRGLPSWDLSLLGAAGHGNALAFSMLLPLGLTALAYGVPSLRAPLAGLAVGVAAHLLFFVVAPLTDVHGLPAVAGLQTLWLIANAVGCVALAKLALRK